MLLLPLSAAFEHIPREELNLLYSAYLLDEERTKLKPVIADFESIMIGVKDSGDLIAKDEHEFPLMGEQVWQLSFISGLFFFKCHEDHHSHYIFYRGLK